MTRLRLAAMLVVCFCWAVLVFLATEAQAAWRRMRGLPEIEERWA